MPLDSATPQSTPPAEEARPAPIAPLWHTVLLIVILLAIAAYGARYQSEGPAPTATAGRRPGMVPVYLSLMVSEWALLWFVLRGVRRRGHTLRDLIGGRWSRPRDVARDAAWGLGFWAAWTVLESFAAQLLGPDTARGIGSLLPRGGVEIALWVLLSLSAGICEEAVFRGYLLRQLHALSGSAALGVLGQGVIFGISHGYQGRRLMITIAAYGVLFGLLARSRRSLRPGMIAHAWQDVFSGI